MNLGWNKVFLFVFLFMLSFVPLIMGCSSNPEYSNEDNDTSENTDTNDAAPVDKTDPSHGKEAEPDYDMVFTQDSVKRIDIEISAENWKAMLADMTDIYGKFGEGSQQEGSEEEFDDLPDWDLLLEACEGKSVGDQCSFEWKNQKVDGVCVNEEGELYCEFEEEGGEEKQKRNPIWVPCTVKFNNEIWNYVGIRFKGDSSLSATWSGGKYKLPFKLDFDQFEDEYPQTLDQRFYGFKKLSFGNNVMDSSYLRDKIASDIYRDSGVPAAKTAFMRVFIDHGDGPIYFGLYTMAEVPGRPMFLSQFGDKGGNLYKPVWFASADAWRIGGPVDETTFVKKNNEEKADWSDLIETLAAFHADQTDTQTWRNNLNEKFEINGFMKWLAINTVIQQWDVYYGNYYLYGDPTENGRLHWIPWDFDMAFQSDEESMKLDMSNVDNEMLLIRKLFDDAEGKKAYRQYVKECIENEFSEESFVSRIQIAYDLIEPFVTGKHGEAQDYTFTDSHRFEVGLADLKSHVKSRIAAANKYLSGK